MSRVYVFTEYGGPQTEALIERPVPEPGPGELLVEVRAAGVNPADLKLREGVFGRGGVLPRPMGFEVAGVVSALGPGVEGYAVGDEVLGPVARDHGGFADHTVVPVDDAVTKPANVSFAVASTLPVAGTTAYDLTHQVELGGARTMLVLGASGGVGHLAAQLGRARGLRVIGIASERGRKLVESTGASFVPSGEGVAEAVRALAPDGVDLVVDLVGGQPLREVAPLATATGQIVSAADTSTAGELSGSGRVTDPEALGRLTALVAAHLVTPRVSAELPLERAGDALALVGRGGSGGKVVVLP